MERCELKLRAYEMVMVLFYVERLKSFSLGCIRATDRLFRSVERIPPGTKKTFHKVWKILEQDGIITSREKSEIMSMINFRNKIAHSIEKLTFDVSRDAGCLNLVADSVSYDSTSLDRLREIDKNVRYRMQRQYVITMDLRDMMFDSALEVYGQERERLRKRRVVLIEQRHREIQDVEAQLKAIPEEVVGEFGLFRNAQHFKSNGTLSSEGVRCFLALENQGLSNLSISYAMGLSLDSVRRRKQL